jgi:hypothetical protein
MVRAIWGRWLVVIKVVPLQLPADSLRRLLFKYRLQYRFDFLHAYLIEGLPYLHQQSLAPAKSEYLLERNRTDPSHALRICYFGNDGAAALVNAHVMGRPFDMPDYSLSLLHIGTNRGLPHVPDMPLDERHFERCILCEPVVEVGQVAMVVGVCSAEALMPIGFEIPRIRRLATALPTCDYSGNLGLNRFPSRLSAGSITHRSFAGRRRHVPILTAFSKAGKFVPVVYQPTKRDSIFLVSEYVTMLMSGAFLFLAFSMSRSADTVLH